MTQQQAKEQLVDRLEGVSFSLSLSRKGIWGDQYLALYCVIAAVPWHNYY